MSGQHRSPCHKTGDLYPIHTPCPSAFSCHGQTNKQTILILNIAPGCLAAHSFIHSFIHSPVVSTSILNTYYAKYGSCEIGYCLVSQELIHQEKSIWETQITLLCSSIFNSWGLNAHLSMYKFLNMFFHIKQIVCVCVAGGVGHMSWSVSIWQLFAWFLDQWFSNIPVHKNCLGSWLKSDSGASLPDTVIH